VCVTGEALGTPLKSSKRLKKCLSNAAMKSDQQNGDQPNVDNHASCSPPD
jgi:hypothetical protein